MADRGKLKQLVLYIAHSFKGAEYFGSTKLNKALYNSEAACYVELGAPLTGFAYKKNFYGPTLTAFLPIVREMREDELIDVHLTENDEERVVPRQQPDMALFSAEELRIIDRELNAIRDLTGKQTHKRSHETAAWFGTKLGETIPWDLALVENPDKVGPLSPDFHDWANDVIDQHLRRSGSA